MTRLGLLTSHPIQYEAPLFRELARRTDLVVYFAHRQTPEGQAAAGFGVPFDWDVDLLAGYEHVFLRNVARRPDVSRFSGCDTPEVVQEITNAKFDAFVVTGWYLRSHWQAIRGCRRLGVPVLARGDSQLDTGRPLLRRLAGGFVHRWVMRRFDGFLVVGKRNEEYLRHYGAPANKIFFAPHCVDNEWFSSRAQSAATQRPATRRELGCGGDARLVLFVGKLIPKKRPLDVVEAVARLRADGANAVAAFVGSGALEGAVRSRAAALDVPIRITGFRNQSELPAMYAAADVLVLPSASETWGLAVNEAMACGLQAVVSDRVGCGPDLVEPGVTGEVFRCGATAGLAAGLARALVRAGSPRVVAAVKSRVAAYSVGAAATGITEAVRSVARLADAS
ncbi:MAG: glycosyltransferase family 4 protein [Acidobacteriia bacterium]|nr:glycosyltransferase family 4 protein [Terriglobia bacterium]